MKPATLPLTAERHAPFVYRIRIEDYSLSGALLDMHVRQYFDQPGDPLINLNLLGSGDTEGLSIEVDTSGALPVSTIQIRIDKATMEALLDATEIGDDLALAYDLHVTPAAGDEQIWFRGPFTVRAGATF